jgi:hypothetical protein
VTAWFCATAPIANVKMTNAVKIKMLVFFIQFSSALTVLKSRSRTLAYDS